MSEGAVPNSKRYDRQIRVWGTVGQGLLEACRVCLLHAGPTGSETLKNLVLGGIGGFTVVDGAKVTERDLGNNFMLAADSLGGARAKAVTELLQELNENVAGTFAEEEPTELIEKHPEFFADFDIVIAAQLPHSKLLQLDDICRKAGVKLLAVRSYGLTGSLRCCVDEHIVIDSRPDNKVDDLRLHAPWPELAAHAATYDLDALDEIAHKHVPYAVLLIQAAQVWRANHGGALPQTYEEKKAFKDTVAAYQRVVDGFPLDEENVAEALASAHKVWAPPGVPRELEPLLSDAAATDIGSDSPLFWVFVAALGRFITAEGALPVVGSIPDMTATTDMYLALTRIYRDKAEADLAALRAHAKAVLENVGRDPAVDDDKLRTFAKNAACLRVVRPAPLREEAACSGDNIALRAALAAEDTATNAGLFVLLRAADAFQAAHGRYPGTFDGDVDQDIPLLNTCVSAVLAEAGATGATVSDDSVGEICRFGAGELHAVASVMGGMASQEAIKLVTEVYVPIAGTLVYNGMAGTTSVFTF